uniref:Rubisco LSMT substrate-binding domain-containing protein n=1 Tax=Peronospora matthiolae TaxID=2874970 RepID=A0AAV1V2T7_9STRA
MSSSAVVSALLKWLEGNGTTDMLLEIRYLGKCEGHGVLAKQSLACGQVALQIPFRLTMTIESAAHSDLALVLKRHPQIPPDEVLALHLMHERSKGKRSFFAPFIASLPATFDLPVFWSEAELIELKGTNVLLLTQMMQRQLKRDYQSIHQEVTDEFPEIFAPLPTLTLEDYTWAMAVIWSRAFGVTKDGRYLRLLCPAMDMFNHDVNLHNPLDDFVSFDEEKQMMVHHVPTEVPNGSAVNISYGQYSNAKLLYSYGFVAQENSRRAVDFWVKIPPADPYLKLKQTLLDTNELTKEQTYDFCGTLFRNDVDERLLATLRVVLMDEQEIRLYKKVRCL